MKVAIGQIWKDCDKRILKYKPEGRFLRVVGIEGPKAVCVSMDAGKPRRSRISLRRFTPGPTGYEWVSGVDTATAPASADAQPAG
jgi:hypothetical protein